MIKALCTLLALCSLYANAALLDTDKQDLNAVSIIKNGGFEDGTGRWTASGGTFTTVTSGTNLLTGKVSATWDSGSASQTLTSTAVAIPKGLYGRNGMAQCRIQVPSGTATHTLEAYDGSNILVSTTITSSTLPTYTQINFIYPSSGNISLRLVSVASDEPLIAIDDCWLGDAINITNVSQAGFAGESYFAMTTNCAGWTRSSLTLGAFATDADCPGPTVVSSPIGTWATTDSNLPRQTITNLPPGRYKAQFIAFFEPSGSSHRQFATIYDGTSQCVGSETSVATSNDHGGPVVVDCWFEYPSGKAQADFELYAAVSNVLGDATIKNDWTGVSGTSAVKFSLVRYPLASQQVKATENSDYDWTAYTPTISAGFGTASSISFFHKRVGDTLFVRGTFTAGTVAASLATITLPGSLAIDSAKTSITNTSGNPGPSVGNYRQGAASNGGRLVTATGTSTSLIYFGDRYADTAGLTPQNGDGVTSNSGVVAVEFAVPISGWVTSNRAPQLVNSVVNSSSGVTATESAKINCDAGSTIMSQHGNWVASVGNISAGACAITLNSGVFSAAPYCTVTAATSGGWSTTMLYNVDATSSTAVSVDCEIEASTACTSTDFILECKGPK